MTNNEMTATLLFDAKSQLGEGSFWHPKENKLYWVDIEKKELHIYDPGTKIDRHFVVPARIGSVVPVEDGGALVALESGIHFIDTKTGKLTFLNNPLSENIRFNDGKCDPSGRFWVGSMELDFKQDAASLYRFDKNNSIHEMVTNITCSNGIVWTADKKIMYYTDTPTGNIDAFNYDDATGNISNRRVVIKIPVGIGYPDGMTLDSEDKLWVALWGGNGVARFDPLTGKMLLKINVPAPHTTSCSFGGKDLKILYITTAREGLNDEQLKEYPLSGSLFSIDLDVKGAPANFYKGSKL
ncbi:MAG: SMP-30/gluconolactonase/LRE family protein [Panacibacter sp.]